MTKIETMARTAYFAQDRSERCSLGQFMDGYQEGFQMALYEVKLAMGKPNNKDKIESINELIKEYDIC